MCTSETMRNLTTPLLIPLGKLKHVSFPVFPGCCCMGPRLLGVYTDISAGTVCQDPRVHILFTQQFKNMFLSNYENWQPVISTSW